MVKKELKQNVSPVGAAISRPHFREMTQNNNKKIVGVDVLGDPNSRGITLIALVITIIIMLILVGVTVTVALNGGLFSTAKQAAQGTETKRDEELKTATGEVTVDNKTYGSIEDYLAGNEKQYAVYTSNPDSENKTVYLIEITQKERELDGGISLNEETKITLEDGTKVDVDELPQLQDGDTFIYGDYEYKYMYGYFFDYSCNASTSYTVYLENDSGSWVNTNEGFLPTVQPFGWGVRVLDDTKEEYEEVLSLVFGEPVTNLSFTFCNCVNLKTFPQLSNKVFTLGGAFFGCSSLTEVPDLSEYGVCDNFNYTFAYCENLTKVGKLPQYTDDLNFTFAFSGIKQAPENFSETYTFQLFGTFAYSDLEVTPSLSPHVYSLDGCFIGCANLTKITDFPEESEMRYAFYDCESLIEVPRIPDSVRCVGQTFSYCYEVEKPIELPCTLKYLETDGHGCCDYGEFHSWPEYTFYHVEGCSCEDAE